MNSLPAIRHSRSTLHCYLNEFPDGARVLVISAHTYPALFETLHPNIVKKSPTGWRPPKSGKSMMCLWFPPDTLDQDDLGSIENWQVHFETYVLLGSNPHLDGHFTDELDYCMALDFTYLPTEEKRTTIGEAEYQFKYHGSQEHFGALRSALVEALDYLPLDEENRKLIVITWVPALPAKESVPRKLARAMAEATGHDLVAADLLTDKGSLKGLSVEQKIPEWKRIYSTSGSVALGGSVVDRTVVVVDDLYQSGATLWSFAAFLKHQGARSVIGLPCVKSLRDADNQ